jgi:hypothetical protein
MIPVLAVGLAFGISKPEDDTGTRQRGNSRFTHSGRFWSLVGKSDTVCHFLSKFVMIQDNGKLTKPL